KALSRFSDIRLGARRVSPMGSGTCARGWASGTRRFGAILGVDGADGTTKVSLSGSALAASGLAGSLGGLVVGPFRELRGSAGAMRVSSSGLVGAAAAELADSDWLFGSFMKWQLLGALG